MLKKLSPEVQAIEDEIKKYCDWIEAAGPNVGFTGWKLRKFHRSRYFEYKAGVGIVGINPEEPSPLPTSPRVKPKKTAKCNGRRIIVDDFEYESIVKASKQLGFSPQAIFGRIQNKNFPTWRYADDNTTSDQVENSEVF